MNLKSLFFPKRYDLSNASAELNQEILDEYNRNRPAGPKEKVCYTPHKSIYFGHLGKAIACCYNRTFILGEYPAQSIHEIWFGEKAQELRTHLDQNNLDHGCSHCLTQIVSKNFANAKASHSDEQHLNDNGYPSVMEFELSNICNLECTMCNGNFSSLIRQNREGRPPVKVVYDEAFVTQLEEFIPHLQEMKFFGGEPFLVDIYYRIWELVVTINPSIRLTVQTNGTVLNQRVKDICAKGRFHISVSIDSLEKENYERIRKNAKFERVMENLDWFRIYCQSNDRFFGISTCAMRQNWRELPNFVIFGNDNQAPIYFHTVTHPSESSFALMSKVELEEIVNTISSIRLPIVSPLQIKNRRQLLDTINYINKLIQRTSIPVFDNQSVESLDDFKDYLIRFIESYDEWSDTAKEKKITVISKKLEQIHQSLGDDFPYGEKFKEVELVGTESVLNILGLLESMPVSAIVLLAKTSS